MVDAEGLLGDVLVVRPAQESHVARDGRAAESYRLDVIELESGTLGTAFPVRSQERTPASVSSPHLAHD
jgi:hypothetical protein